MSIIFPPLPGGRPGGNNPLAVTPSGSVETAPLPVSPAADPAMPGDGFALLLAGLLNDAPMPQARATIPSSEAAGLRGPGERVAAPIADAMPWDVLTAAAEEAGRLAVAFQWPLPQQAQTADPLPAPPFGVLEAAPQPEAVPEAAPAAIADGRPPAPSGQAAAMMPIPEAPAMEAAPEGANLGGANPGGTNPGETNPGGALHLQEAAMPGLTSDSSVTAPDADPALAVLSRPFKDMEPRVMAAPPPGETQEPPRKTAFPAPSQPVGAPPDAPSVVTEASLAASGSLPKNPAMPAASTRPGMREMDPARDLQTAGGMVVEPGKAVPVPPPPPGLAGAAQTAAPGADPTPPWARMPAEALPAHSGQKPAQRETTPAMLPPVVLEPRLPAQQDLSGIPVSLAGAAAPPPHSATPQQPAPQPGMPAGFSAQRAQQAAHAAPQLAMRIAQAQQQGVDRISVDLRPPELGRVELQMTFRDGTVQVVMRAEQPETFEALRQERHHLEQQMTEAGLQLGAGGLDLQQGRLPRPEPEATLPRQAANAAHPDEASTEDAAPGPRPTASDSLIDIIA